MLAGALSLLATFLCPAGPRIWWAIASLGSNAYITSKIPEYQSADFHVPETWPFVLMLLLTVTAFARTARKVGWTDILPVVAFAAFALYSSRMIPIFAVITAPIAAKTFADWLREELPNRELPNVGRKIDGRSFLNSIPGTPRRSP